MKALDEYILMVLFVLLMKSYLSYLDKFNATSADKQRRA